MSVSPAPTTRGARLKARAEALATPRNGALLLAAGMGLAVVFFVARPTYPNYDSYYNLIWGDQLAHGHLPDYNVFRSPTPHPLATLLGALLSPFGAAADRILVLLTLGTFVGLVAVLFRFTQLLVGTLVALVVIPILLTRTDLEFFSARAIVDVPFLLLIFSAALLELRKPRRGWSVIVVLGLAGLLRPEAWLFSGVYVLWLYPGCDRKQWIMYALGAAAAPVLWLAQDAIVTGDPFYSLTSTREVAGQLKRDRGVGGAITSIPDYIGANEKIVNVISGGLGGLLAIYLMRMRAALPLVLTATGFITFLLVAAAGLSVIPRYLIIPSLIFNLCVAVALVGWALVEEPRVRRAAIALAALTVALVLFRAPSIYKDFQKLNGQTLFVSKQHDQLKRILDDPRTVALIAACRPLTVPTHSAIPVVRYQTGLGKHDLQASINQKRPPDRGVLLVGDTFNFEPNAARATSGPKTESARKWWSNYALSGFGLVARNEKWRVYAKGC